MNGTSLRAEASKNGTVPGPIGGCPRLLRVEATAVAKSLTPMNGISAFRRLSSCKPSFSRRGASTTKYENDVCSPKTMSHNLLPVCNFNKLQILSDKKNKKIICKALKLRLLRRWPPWLHQTRKLGTAPDKAGDSPKFTPCGCKKRLN